MDRIKVNPDSKRLAYSMAEVADLFGASMFLVKRAVAEGKIPSQKILGRRFIAASDLEKVLSGELS
jgi:hypothetical protein